MHRLQTRQRALAFASLLAVWRKLSKPPITARYLDWQRRPIRKADGVSIWA